MGKNKQNGGVAARTRPAHVVLSVRKVTANVPVQNYNMSFIHWKFSSLLFNMEFTEVAKAYLNRKDQKYRI